MPQTVVQHILANSLIRSNEIQKFVLETCKHLQKAQQFEGKIMDTDGVFSADEDKLELGWYLRESGNRWTSIQIISAAYNYCQGQEESDTEFN